MLESGRDVARAGGAGARRGREARRCGAGDGVAWCPAVSHAIPSEYLASSYRFVYLSHSCLGIACDFGGGDGVGACGVRGAGGWSGHVMGRVVWGCGAGHVAVGRSSRADDRGKGIPCGT